MCYGPLISPPQNLPAIDSYPQVPQKMSWLICQLNYVPTNKLKIIAWDFPGSPVIKTLLPMQEAWVPSLACDQGTKICVLHSLAKPKKKKKLWLNQVGFKTGSAAPTYVDRVPLTRDRPWVAGAAFSLNDSQQEYESWH